MSLTHGSLLTGYGGLDLGNGVVPPQAHAALSFLLGKV